MSQERHDHPDRKEAIYRKLAAELEEMLSGGAFRPGDRMPSLRKISVLHEVSLTTALQAFYLLEERGLIEARPQSGFFVRSSSSRPDVPDMTNQTTITPVVEIYDEVNRIREDFIRLHHEGISFGLGIPSDQFVPVPAMTKMILKATKVKGSFGYEYGQGNIDLRRQIAMRSADAGMNLSPDDIIITSGTLDALTLSLMVTCNPGDIVALESPTYFGLLQLIEALKMQVVEIPTHPETGISLKHLEKALSMHNIRALIVQPVINNPLGCSMPEENKQKLAQMMNKHNVQIIEDDADGELIFGSHRPKAVKHYDKSDRSIYCSSFSKILGAGCRVGWVVPGVHKEQMLKLKKCTALANPTLLQHAINFMLSKGSYDRHLRKIRRLFARQIESMRLCVEQSFPPGTKISHPAGGFLLWIELPGNRDATQLYEKALAEHISIAPGHIFSTQKKYRNCFRLNAAGLLWGEKSEKALRRLGQICHSLPVRGR